MKKIIPFVIALLLYSCAPKNIQQLAWENTNEVNTKIPKYYNSKSKIAYEVTNDDQYLYLKMLIGDEITKKQMLMSGMLVWLDTTKKYTKKFGLCYPLKGKKPPATDKNKSGQLQPKKPKRELSKNQFKTINLNNYQDGLHNVITQNELALQLNIDENGYLVYHAKIPISCFYITSLTELDSTDLFSLNIIIPGIILPNKQSNPSQSSVRGGPPHGGGRGQGGSRPGGNQGGSRESTGQSEMAEDKEIKVRFKLNLKK